MFKILPPCHWEDPLEKGTATHSGILASRRPWTEEPAACSPVSESEVIEWVTHLQSSYLANPIHTQLDLKQKTGEGHILAMTKRNSILFMYFL